jgi:superfamily II DNA or RNA helicase
LFLKKFVITSYAGNYKIKNFICKELFYIIFAYFIFFLLYKLFFWVYVYVILLKLREFKGMAKFILRDYQKNFIKDIHSQFCAGYKAVCGQSPTGSGKTVIFSYIANGAINQGSKVVILVHRQELILQTSLALAKFQIPNAIIAPASVIKSSAQIQYRELGRNYIDLNSPCVVASVQTLGRRLDEFTNYFDFIITDECFVGDTLIKTKNGYKKIKNIKSGDFVYTFNEKECFFEYKPVEKRLKKPLNENLIRINNIICTENHLFFTKNNWKKAKDLTISDFLLNEYFNFVKIKSITNVKKNNEDSVYDLTVADNHNYFANGFLVHNCHHAVAGQWRNVTDRNPNAFLLGLTATPERLDGKGLGIESGGVYEKLVLGPSVKSLIERGYLSQPRVFAPPINFDDSALRTIAGDYDVKQMSEMLDQPQIIGDCVRHYSKICPNMPAIAFCSTIEHARHTAEQFCNAGFNFKCIDGTMSDFDRRDAIEGLGSGRYDGLTSCNIISEGTDIPVVGCAIFLRKTKSLSLYLQQAGRVLRPYSGKEYSIILDHVRNVENHGFPEDERDWSLEGRRKQKRDEDEIFIRTCPQCYACYKSSLRACPVCGFGAENAIKSQREIEFIDAELVEIQKAQKERERKEANAFNKLLELGKQRGYSNPYAWAKIVLNSRKRKRK